MKLQAASLDFGIEQVRARLVLFHQPLDIALAQVEFALDGVAIARLQGFRQAAQMSGNAL
jgi:hypothetical protein